MLKTDELTGLVFALLCGLLGLVSAVALGDALLDAYATGQVYLPRLSRYRPASNVPWPDATVYLLALAAWAIGGCVALPAFLWSGAWRSAAISAFAAGAALFLLSWWHPLAIASLLALAIAFACSAFRVGPFWLRGALLVGAVALVAYLFAT